MTISVANVDTTSDSFGQWISKTNILADALTNKIVTTDSNTAVGNAAISGAMTANALFGGYLSGGTPAAPANLIISSNTTVAANLTFSGNRINLGPAANIAINSGNSTYRVVMVNSAAGNTLQVGKITFSDHSDVSISSPTSGQILSYNSSTQTWNNSGFIQINPITGVITGSANIVATGNVVAAGFQYSNGAVFSSLIVYYANGMQAFP